MGYPLIPDFVARQPTGLYRTLSPTTKFVIALCEAAVAFTVRGWTGPLVIIGIVAACAAAARIGRSLIVFLAAVAPLVVSILLVNTFFYPGATDVIIRLGPVAATWSGLEAALQATLRVTAFALSVAVFSLTTSVDDLLTDLEGRGLGRRPVFVVGAAISTVPRMRHRAVEVVEAQRSRGMDTEGSPARRLRGLVPLVGPMIFGALADVEEQAMALEARAFSAPVRRTPIRELGDSPRQRVFRWGLALLTGAAVIASLLGLFPLP